MGLKDSLKDSVILMVGATIVILGIYSDLNKEVYLNLDGKTLKYNTFASTVGDFLKNKNIDIEKWSKIKPSLDTELKYDMEITVDNKFKISINDGEEKNIYSVNQDTVENVLDACNIDLGEKDILNKELNDKINPNESIEIIRIVEKEEKEREEISYSTKVIKDTKLPEGESRIVSKGEFGEKEIKYRVTYKNGNKILKEVLSEDIIKEPVDEIIRKGALKVQSI